MLEPPEARPYPPDSIWRFPPPPVSRLWLVVAIVGGVLGLTAFGGATTYLALNGFRVSLPRVADVPLSPSDVDAPPGSLSSSPPNPVLPAPL